ncbi:hypothetical protein [Novosphingobium sp. P6W]|uniref:hypothetical protein n=1 Tax=Novosphingobium sp. P6W TaxID=1609758 RepID=UPI0005C32351|nr:hypothetical protein [Novosphingobium sp. P6W]AXB77056.1 hypothetical protein TQ38_011590 [Novosphingobium sp. P6W]KIS29739.1 hypothetical protein TQ38_26940 [Novosphingobium sp. P6W]
MNFASVLFYPILLLLPAAGATDVAPRADDVRAQGEQAPADIPPKAHAWPKYEIPGLSSDSPFPVSLLSHALPQDAWQVRIEQRMIIRITPRSAVPMPEMFMGMPDGDGGMPQITERKIGNCLPVAGIASVRPDRANRLLLFMRDRRVVSAELDRSCRARDFYSGFLLEDIPDGRLCVDRDTLLSRSGMNCKLTRIRELIEQDR